jgi:membrane protein
VDPRAGALARFWAGCYRFAALAQTELGSSQLSLHAASLVYTTLLSLVPFLAVAFSMLKAFGAHSQLEPLLERGLAPLGQEGSGLARQIVSFVDNLEVGVLGTAGVAGLLLTVISLVESVEQALNRIWRVRRPRSLGRRFTDYLSVVLVGPVLVFTAFAITASAESHGVVRWVRSVGSLDILVVLGTWVLPFVFVCGAFTFLYRFLPNTRVRSRPALVGGLTAGILWELAGMAFTAFVATSAQYTAIYSSFAILVLFLLWLYVGWFTVLVGAEVAYFWQHPAACWVATTDPGRNHAFRERLALSALVAITRRHLEGEPPGRLSALATALHVPAASVDEVLDRLVERGVLCRTAEPEALLLARSPDLITVSEVLDVLRDADGRASRSEERLVGPVTEVLGRRDQAAARALDGLTLTSLAAAPPGGEGSR